LLEKVEIELWLGEEKNTFQMVDLGDEMVEIDEMFTFKLHQI
jgi:hypothetical protein